MPARASPVAVLSMLCMVMKTLFLYPSKATQLYDDPSAAMVDVNAGHEGNFLYITYAEKATHPLDDSASFFFQEKDIRPGTKMNLRFYNPMPASTFLPRDVADSILFSTSKTTEIFSKLSIEPTSAEATAIKNTLNVCEKPAAKGEERFCATSLESMVDFAISTLGKDAKVVSTEAAEDSKLRTYTVAPDGVQELKGRKSVTCHRQAYAYSVYYCHETYETSKYTVPLVRDDGSVPQRYIGMQPQALGLPGAQCEAWNSTSLPLFCLKNILSGFQLIKFYGIKKLYVRHKYVTAEQ